MGIVISFANQKGGVGKTTSVFNIGVSLARKGKRTLIIDLDSQASLTISANLEPFEIENSIVSAMQKNGLPMSECILPLQDNLFIVASRLELAEIEFELFNRLQREIILKKVVEPIKSDYDFILIDCPPQYSLLTLNALACSDFVIIPVETVYLAYRGVDLILSNLQGIQEEINPNLEIMGIIATMHDMRIKDNRDILELLKEQYNVIATIKRLAIVKQGIYDGQSVSDINPNSEIALEYDKVCDLIIEKGSL